MILLRLHFISLSCMIYTIVYTFDIFLDYIYIYSWYCWYRIRVNFFQLWAVAFSRTNTTLEKGQIIPWKVVVSWKTSQAVLVSLHAYGLLICDFAACLFRTGAAEMEELRCPFQVIQSFREKRKRRLTTCGLTPDSCQIPLTNVRYFRILSTCSNVVGVFCANVPCCSI